MAQPTFIDTCLPNGDVQRVNTQIIPAATYAKAVANFVNNPGNPNSAPFLAVLQPVAIQSASAVAQLMANPNPGSASIVPSGSAQITSAPVTGG